MQDEETKFTWTTKTETWSRDACELIDYECDSLIESIIETKHSGQIYRNGDWLTYGNSPPSKSSKIEKWISIKMWNSDITLQPNLFQVEGSEDTAEFNCTNPAWFVFKDSKCPLKNKQYPWSEGDIFKVGRITLRIKEIKVDKCDDDKMNNNNNSVLTSINNEKKNNIKATQIQLTTSPYKETKHIENTNSEQIRLDTKDGIKLIKSKTKANCRICYCDDNSDENPLVQPCICSGTMRYIHWDCWKQWLRTRSCVKIDSNEKCAIFIIRQVQCELCKIKLPDYIRHNGKLYEILDFHSEFETYIIVESLCLDKYNNKFIYIVSLDDFSTITIGRGHNSNLILSDISISRLHCIITKVNNHWYWSDNDSKFSTWVLIQAPEINLMIDTPLHIQIGRTYFKFNATVAFSLFGCCSGNQRVSENIFYYQQNSKTISYQKTVNIKDEPVVDESFSSDEKESEKNEMETDAHLKVCEDEENDNGMDIDYQETMNKGSKSEVIGRRATMIAGIEEMVNQSKGKKKDKKKKEYKEEQEETQRDYQNNEVQKKEKKERKKAKKEEEQENKTESNKENIEDKKDNEDKNNVVTQTKSKKEKKKSKKTKESKEIKETKETKEIKETKDSKESK